MSAVKFDQFNLDNDPDQRNFQEYIESQPHVIDLDKRAWNSGFYGGLGKRG